MTKIIVDIDEDLNKRFRDMILKRKGWNKGVIRDSLIEAIECWIFHEAPSQVKPSQTGIPNTQT